MNDTELFLSLLYRDIPAGWLEITYLDPTGNQYACFDWKPLPLEISDPEFKRLHTRNAQGYGVYVGMATRRERKPERQRGKQNDATYISHLWCDIDDCDPIEGADRLCDFPIAPSLIISSGGGVHGYWLLDSPLAVTEDTFQPIRRALHGLAMLCEKGGDASVRDLARVMRVPGFMNVKRGTPCQIIDAYDVRWDWQRLHARFAKYAPQEPPRVTRSIPESARGKQIPDVVNAWLNLRETEGMRNKKLYWTACTLYSEGFSEGEILGIVTNKAQSDGLQDEEIEKTVHSACRGARGTSTSNPLNARMAWADSRLGGK